MKANSEFLKIKSGNVVNFVRFSSISALEFNQDELTIAISIEDHKENFIIKCGNHDVFTGYTKVIDTILKLGYDFPPQNT